jgi:molecular chaperone Hsp33
MTRDFSQKFLFNHRPIRGQFIRLTETYQSMIRHKNYPEKIQKFLGEALASTALIHGLFKNSGKITLQFQGSGALTLLSIHGDLSDMRGLVQYSTEALFTEKDSLLSALKTGKLVLTYEAGDDHGNSRHQSILEVISPDMAQNIEHYFSQSEQVETKIWLAVTPLSVSGFLLQRLPSPPTSITETDHSDPNNLGDDLCDDLWNDAIIRAQTLFEQELQTLPLEDLLSRLYSEDEIQLFQPEEIEFKCPCSKDRMERAILFMGKPEVMAILEKEEHVDVTCQFCGKNHAFDAIDIEKIFRG